MVRETKRSWHDGVMYGDCRIERLLIDAMVGIVDHDGGKPLINWGLSSKFPRQALSRRSFGRSLGKLIAITRLEG